MIMLLRGAYFIPDFAIEYDPSFLSCNRVMIERPFFIAFWSIIFPATSSDAARHL